MGSVTVVPDDRLTAELNHLNGIHRKITLPSGESICDSDRRKWPCHARRLLEALGVLMVHHAACGSQLERDRLAAILTGDDGG